MKKIILILIIINISIINIHAQNANRQSIKNLSVDLGIALPIQKNTSNTQNILFQGNGGSVGGNFKITWPKPPYPQPGIIGSTLFNFGKVNVSDIESFATTLIPNPFKAKITQKSKSWSQLQVMAGPLIELSNNGKGLILEAQAGVAFNLSSNTIKIDQYDANTFMKTVYEKKENSTSLAWKVGANIPIVPKLHLVLGYGSNGGNAALRIKIKGNKADKVDHVTHIKKQDQINERISYGSCPKCGNGFSNNDDVYHHSCLRTWIDQEFNTNLKWLNTVWNGEIDGIFNLPQIFTAVPVSKSIEEYLKDLLKEKLLSIKIQSNEVTLITKNNDKYITEVLITNPDPSPLAHFSGVKISCIGSCSTGCQVDNTNGTYSCVKCNDINNLNLCKTNVKGDFGLDITYETLRLASGLFAVDETNNGNEEYLKSNIKNLVKENLPVGFLPIKSQLVANGKTKNLLLHCSDGKSAVILVGRVTEKLLSNQFIIVQGEGVPAKIDNLERHIKKSLKGNSKLSTKKIEYVGHVTLLR
jgi:hypothetical protein